MENLLNLVSVLMISFWLAVHIQSKAQSKPEYTLTGLNDQQERGQGVFLQSCSFCHILQEQRQSFLRLGYDLTGSSKGSRAKKETEVREIILKGTARMPGF